MMQINVAVFLYEDDEDTVEYMEWNSITADKCCLIYTLEI